MKINPPKITIDENAPFKEALFGREEFAKSLTNLIQNVSESLVVFVNAPWGAGKTTFSEMWQAYLKLQKHEVIYFNAFDLTLRDIEKAFTVMALYFGSLQHNQFANPVLVALLSVLKIKQPALYQSLSKGTISANQFFQQTAINQLKTNDQNFNLDWTKDVLNYCLMSDTELATAKNEAELNRKGDRFSDMSMWVRGNRNQAIPALCGQMDRFSLLPRSK
jgi:hypothetical protein